MTLSNIAWDLLRLWQPKGSETIRGRQCHDKCFISFENTWLILRQVKSSECSQKRLRHQTSSFMRSLRLTGLTSEGEPEKNRSTIILEARSVGWNWSHHKLLPLSGHKLDSVLQIPKPLKRPWPQHASLPFPIPEKRYF